MSSSVPAALLRQLSSASESLNNATAQFNEQINSIESALASYNLGVSAAAHACAIDHEERDEAGNVVDVHIQDISVAYEKWGGKWCLMIRSFYRDSETFEEWPMRDAPRHLRLRAIQGIPTLLEQLVAEATKLAQEVATKTAEARTLAESIRPKKGQ